MTGFFSFFLLSIPKARETSSHCCPPSCGGMFGPRPARMVPSITHGLILAPLASSRERMPTHLPGPELQPPTWPPPWSSARLLACPGHPSSGHCLVCFPGPRGRGGKGKGEAAGEGEKREEWEGPPSLIS